MLAKLIGDQTHFIPSYTGYCPQAKYVVGQRYAATTNQIINDPRYAHIYRHHWHNDNRSSNKADFDAIANEVNARAECHGDAIYRHPMVSTYAGHLPRRSTNDIQQLGQRFTPAATHGIRDFYSHVNVGHRNVPNVQRRPHRVIETNFKANDERATFYKLGHAGHHPLQYAHFGTTNMMATTKSKSEFDEKCVQHKIKRRSPIMTTVMC